MNESLNKITERSEHTLQLLEAALQRLLLGKPEKTRNDGRINISRINDEAGLSAGAIYYYKDFLLKSRRAIEQNKINKDSDTRETKSKNLDRLRAQRDNEVRLKEKYRDQRDEIKSFCDKVIEKNANLEFTLYEALEKIEVLETELEKAKVVKFERGKKS
ncbi:hypothetical protein QC823_07535 [Halomonas vilamensis]|uniref:Orphan protein n=1 Tax=Vreelandella vilamensis TaxID=531309 RepID=A0ABU1H3G2_9GAMM|nr:hypothetical protein [Halomonas vilamensis]MDR5898838.1 hypothetical protein [Halomonas vilamensis]